MAKKKRRLSAKQADIEKRYKKERNRILRYMATKRKQGYEWFDFSVPKIPKHITEGSVRRLQKITADVLIRKSAHPDPETGESIAGNIFQLRKRREKAKERKERRNWIREKYPRSEEPVQIKDIIKSNILDFVKDIFSEPVPRIVLDSDGVYKTRSQRTMDYIYNNRDNIRKEIEDKLSEQDSGYFEYLEQNKDTIEKEIEQFYYQYYSENDVQTSYDKILAYLLFRPLQTNEQNLFDEWSSYDGEDDLF